MADDICFDFYDAVECIRHEACDVISVYPGKNGGIRKSQQIANYAAEHGIACSIGSNLELDVASAAMCHLVVGCENLQVERYPGDILGPEYHEFSIVENPLKNRRPDHHPQRRPRLGRDRELGPRPRQPCHGVIENQRKSPFPPRTVASRLVLVASRGRVSGRVITLNHPAAYATRLAYQIEPKTENATFAERTATFTLSHQQPTGLSADRNSTMTPLSSLSQVPDFKSRGFATSWNINIFSRGTQPRRHAETDCGSFSVNCGAAKGALMAIALHRFFGSP